MDFPFLVDKIDEISILNVILSYYCLFQEKYIYLENWITILQNSTDKSEKLKETAKFFDVIGLFGIQALLGFRHTEYFFYKWLF